MSRLDQELVQRGLERSRHQAQDRIKQGQVLVNGKKVQKPAFLVTPKDMVEVVGGAKYVSRAGQKLASVASKFRLNFSDQIVLDVGSSTGGFTEYALQNGATRVYAVDVGTDQLAPQLRASKRVVVMEKTDIRKVVDLPSTADIALVDVSFISARKVLPSVSRLLKSNGQIVLLLKPQFETEAKNLHNGVVKNDSIRRQILKDFELWVKNSFVIQAKADSELSGAKGNLERFYLLKPLKH